jgi:hypothetical protein
LTFRLESRHNFARVHADLYELDGHTTAYGLFLLRQPNLAHPALSD